MDPLVRELARLPERLEELLSGWPEAMLRRRPADGGWSAKEIAWHLADAARINHERLFLIATHEQPDIPPYDEAALARDRDYLNLETARIVPSLRSWREETVDLLGGNDPDAWERTGTHPAWGAVSLLQWAIITANHDLEHLRDIAALLHADAGDATDEP